MRKSLIQHAKGFDDLYSSGEFLGATTHHKLVLESVPQLKNHGINSILDVGCGRGHLVSNLMFNHGFQICGTEISNYLIANDLKKLPVYPRSVEDLNKFGQDEFDLVMLVNLLNSLRDREEQEECLFQADRISDMAVLITIEEPFGNWRDKLCEFFQSVPDERRDRSGLFLRMIFWKNE